MTIWVYDFRTPLTNFPTPNAPFTRCVGESDLLGALCVHFGRCNTEILLHNYNFFNHPVAEYRSVPKVHFLSSSPQIILSWETYFSKMPIFYFSIPWEMYDNISNSPILFSFKILRKQYVCRVLKCSTTHAQDPPTIFHYQTLHCSQMLKTSLSPYIFRIYYATIYRITPIARYQKL